MFGLSPTASALAGARNVQLTFQRGCAREKHPGWDRGTRVRARNRARTEPRAPALLGNRLSRKTSGDLSVCSPLNPPQLGPRRVCHLPAERSDSGRGMELP